jgi:hypothetical protein
MRTLSIILPLGFIHQRNEERPELGDEFAHMAPLAEAQCDVELIIVDRAWPYRWQRVEDTLGGMLDRVAYIAPKPSVFVDHGYRAVSSMRNAGAICSSGKVLAFVDDHLILEPRAAEAVCEHYEETGRVLCPVDREDVDARTPEGAASEFSGHNARIYMSRREEFLVSNGYDEQFDGTYGEEDTEWQNRIDQLLVAQHQLRQRRRGLIWRWTFHANGRYVQPRTPFWPELEVGTEYLRCNRAYAKFVCERRLRSGESHGNIVPTDEEVARLHGLTCADECRVCRRGDRDKQIESYKTIPIDDKVAEKMVAWEDRSFAGSSDPWKDER